MTQPTTIDFDEVLIKIGDGASPEVISQTCLMQGERALDFQATFNDVEVPDCSDGDLPASVLRKAQSISFTGSGSGKIHEAQLKAYLDALAAAAPINAEIEVGTADATGALDISTQIVITNLRVTARRTDVAEVEISIASHNFKASDITALTS